MHHAKNDSTSTIFKMAFNFPNHHYPTGFARISLADLTQYKFQITVRGYGMKVSPIIKKLTDALIFKSRVKEIALKLNSEKKFLC